MHTKKIYICIKDDQGNYPAVFSSSPLDDKNFMMDGDAPLIHWLKAHDSCLTLRDFRRTVDYKSMWEEEKRQLETLKIECLLPLKDGDDLAGLVMLGGREHKGKLRSGYSEEDIIFLNSIESVSSIAVKNSRLYDCLLYTSEEPGGLFKSGSAAVRDPASVCRQHGGAGF